MYQGKLSLVAEFNANGSIRSRFVYGDSLIFYFIFFSETISLYFFYKLWRTNDLWLSKFILALVILIPFLGPIVYLLISDNSPRERYQLNANGNLFGRGRYTEWWINEKPKLERKIRSLKLDHEISEKETANKEIKDD